MTLDATGFDYALKTRYSDEVVQFMAYKDNPFFAMVRKDTKFGGKNFVFAMQYSGGGAGRSATFSTAQTNAAYGLGKDFTLTRKKDFAVARIDAETVLASEGDNDALLTAVEDEQNKALYRLIRSIAIGMYGNGSGKLGTVNAPGASTTLTLENSEDITNFEVGMRLVFAADEASALRDSGEVLTVQGVDLDAGTLTVSANVTTIASITDGDCIFAEGDYDSASDRMKIAGLAGWLPATAPTSGDSWFGVDRSADPVRLAGHRVSGTGKAIDEALYDLAARIGRDGGRPDTALISFDNYANLVMLLGSKVVYQTHQIANIGFESIRLVAPKGPIDVFPDQNCPSDVGYVLTKSTWCLKSLGLAPRVLDLDGKRWARISDADGIEIRDTAMGNLYTNAAGWNGRTTL